MRNALKHEDPMVRTHVLRILAEMDAPGEEYYQAVSAALSDYDPHVQRAAVETLARYGRLSTIQQLVDFRNKIPDYDSHLLYTTRLCLRNLLRNEQLVDEVIAGQWDDQQAATLADVLTGVNLEQAGSFLFSYMKAHTIANDQIARLLKHAARLVPAKQLEEVITWSEKVHGNGIETSFRAYTAIRDGMRQRGVPDNIIFERWGRELTTAILHKYFAPGSEESATAASNQEIARQRFALEFAGSRDVAGLEDNLRVALERRNTDRDTRITAARALMQIDQDKNAGLLGVILTTDSADLELRKQWRRCWENSTGKRPDPCLLSLKMHLPLCRDRKSTRLNSSH